MDSLELSRGPNANIFGLGNASGTVNQVPATANLTRDFSRVELRGDSYEGWRASLDVNRRILKNKLSVRASYANQHTGFVRKPSGEDARRLSFQVKAQPFKNTTLSGSWYNYRNAAVRPNFTTPRDYYTGSARCPGNPVGIRSPASSPSATARSTATATSSARPPLMQLRRRSSSPRGPENRSIFQIGPPDKPPTGP